MRPLRGEDPSLNPNTKPYARPLIRHPRVCQIRQTPPLRSDLSPPAKISEMRKKTNM